MKSIKKIIIVLLAVFFSTMSVLAHKTTKDKSSITRDPYKILFIGSSCFNYNNLPALFENLVINSENEVFIDQSITNGLYLEDHANSASTAAKINEENWDYVILQGVGLLTYPSQNFFK